MKTPPIQPKIFLRRELCPAIALCGLLAVLAVTGCRSAGEKDKDKDKGGSSWSGRFNSPPAEVNDPKAGADPNAKLPPPPPEKKQP